MGGNTRPAPTPPLGHLFSLLLLAFPPFNSNAAFVRQVGIYLCHLGGTAFACDGPSGHGGPEQLSRLRGVY